MIIFSTCETIEHFPYGSRFCSAKKLDCPCICWPKYSEHYIKKLHARYASIWTQFIKMLLWRKWGKYCQRTNAQLYVLLTRGVTDGPVSVQARETGAHSGCSQSIPPLWGELQAGLGGLEPAIVQGCLFGLARHCLRQPLSRGPGR